jgi:alpha-L-fucosidase
MKRYSEYCRRAENVKNWLAPSRFGLFYHWGIITAGGCTQQIAGHPLYFKNTEEFEAAIPAPEVIAKNLVDSAVDAGAKYIIFTLIHTCDAMLLLYPSKLPGFINRTRKDYISAVLNEAEAQNVKCLLYFPCCPDDHWKTPEGTWIDESYKERDNFAKLMKEIIIELVEMHGKKIAGFWMDGGLIPSVADFPSFVRKLLPEAIFNANNWTTFDFPGMDMAATEFINSSRKTPVYNRPSAMFHPDKVTFKIAPPANDFIEDIPTCNNWFHHEHKNRHNPKNWKEYLNSRKPYLEDKTYFVKEMISSLGQRGQWNYVLGIGPKLDGTIPDEFRSMFSNMQSFMAWAGEAVYNTTGGVNSLLLPGWWSDGAFGSITQSLENSNIHYAHVTTAPEKDNAIKIQCAGYIPQKITDLRTGVNVKFEFNGTLTIYNTDWDDVRNYGDKIFKIEF